MTADAFTESGAVFSKCRRYRTRLWRVWDRSLPVLVCCLLNPSTADEVSNDPTIERIWRRTIRWKLKGLPGLDFGSIEIVNIFSWRETESRLLKQRLRDGVDLIGPENDAAILRAVSGAGMVICGWGKNGALLSRGDEVLKLLRDAGVQPYALRINGDGSPEHPLYLGYDLDPVPLMDIDSLARQTPQEASVLLA